MSREQLQRTLERYRAFLKAINKHRGDYGAAEDELCQGGADWLATGNQLSEACRELHAIGIDPTPIWSLDYFIRYRLLRGNGELTPEQLQELRRAIHDAFLPMYLFDETASPPLQGIENDIVTAITEAERRMTTSEVLSALENANAIHGESTVKNYLRAMVKSKVLNNNNDGRGYGLPGRP